MKVDFGKTASDYAGHRAGFPDALFDRLASKNIGLNGQAILDLGTGTGSLARGFAKRGARVTAADISQDMLAAARRLDEEAGVSIDYHCAGAEDTGLPGETFDVVTAGQCWHWFDRGRAALEVKRLLKAGGKLAICHFDWLPLPGTVVEATERLVEAHNPDWHWGGGTGLYPDWLTDTAVAGFATIETFSFDVAVPYSREAWCHRMRASSGVGASLPPEKVARFDADLAACLARDFPDDPLAIPHRVFALTAEKPI